MLDLSAPQSGEEKQLKVRPILIIKAKSLGNFDISIDCSERFNGLSLEFDCAIWRDIGNGKACNTLKTK